MLNSFFNLLNRTFPSLSYTASRRWFEYISRRESGRHMRLMNYGYSRGQPIPLDSADEPDRYSIQLYHHVAAAVDLTGKTVLEVGSGRGGGASYVQRCLGPKSVVGVDLARSAIEFSRKHYDVPGLTFARGDAEALDFPDESFDALLNVESSICYEHPERFFAEVVRVLKPGGHFLYADVREADELEEWNAQLAATGLEKLEEEDITAGVVAALDLDAGRRRALIAEHAPWGLQGIFEEFAGVQGTDFYYTALAQREKVYKRFVFRKKLSD